MALNSSMNIQVRIAARNAMTQLARIESELKAVQVANVRTGGAAEKMTGGLSAGLIKAGSTTQWAGRQLTYNFTVPIALAAGAATKFALNNEQAMTRVQKVYGDNSKVMNRLTKTEVPALGKAFRALSDEFGVNQAEVDNVAADWAAAGATGLALAKSTKLTLQTMVLGEMNATEATRALIAIQAQYGMTVDKNRKGTDNLTDTINLLNMVENQTGTDMNDLIVSISRSAGSARSAGVDVRHLAAMTAALVPAAGTAATAGNALKTIFSRILAPTTAASDAMKAMGINTQSAAWQSSNGTKRLEELSRGYMKLSGAQKIQAATAIAGRYQLNRLDILLRDIANKNGYYQKSLNATTSAQGNATQAQKELNTVLRSQPQQFKQLGVMLENMAAQVIGPLVPLFIAVARTIRDLVERFTEINPSVQKFILTSLALLAVFGPILRYVGATTLLLGYLIKAITGTGTAFLKVTKFLLTPFLSLAQVAGKAALVVINALSDVALFIAKPFVATVETGMSGVIKLMAAGFGALVQLTLTPMKAIALGFVSYLTDMLSFATRFPQLFLRLLVTPITAAGGLIVRGWTVALTAFTTITTTFGTVISTIWGALSTGLVTITSTLGAVLGRLWTVTLLFFETALTRIGPALLTVWSTIGTALTTVWEAVQGAIRVAWVATWAFLRSAAFVGPVLDMLADLGAGILSALASPWGIAIAAIVVLLIAFRKKLGDIWHAIISDIGHFIVPFEGVFDNVVEGAIRAFDALPGGVQRAIMAVVKIVASAARQVYQWFSYLNPFAHHSPSLVENVTAGMNVVRNQHEQTNKTAQTHSKQLAATHAQMISSMSNVNNAASTMAQSVSASGATPAAIPAGATAGAGASATSATKSVSTLDNTLKKFQGDVDAFRRDARSLIPSQWASEISDIRKGLPSLLPEFMKLIGEYRQLNQQQNAQKKLVDAQKQVVDQWKTKLDAANKTLNQQTKILDQEQAALSKLKNQYSAASSKMSDYANAPIKGQQNFTDEIFANSEAQKKIQLQMDKWTQKNGSIDDLNSKFAALNGQIMDLQGTADSLRKQGAGSDVLGPINDQIKALQKSADATQQTIANSPVDKLQKQMDKLSLQGQILQEQNDIKFDPLEHQIDKLSNTTKALSYAQIIAGIEAAKKKMAELSPQIKKQSDLVKAQKQVVDADTKSRNAINRQYEKEKKTLDGLTKTYQKITNAMSKMKSVMDSIDSAASDKISAKSSKSAGGVSNSKGNFANVGGTNKIGREGGLKDQSGEIAKFTAEQQKKIGNMIGGLDMFGPFKKMWASFSAWMGKYVAPVWGQIEKGITMASQGIGTALGHIAGSPQAKKAGSFLYGLGKVIVSAIKLIGAVIKLFWPDIENLADGLVQAGEAIWKNLGPALLKLFKSLQNLWPVLKPIVEIIGGALLLVIKVLVSIIVHMLVPSLIAIIKIVSDVIDILADLINFVADVFQGKWVDAFKAIGSLFMDTFKLIWDTVKGIIQPLWGLVKGFIGGIIGFFKWLYDELVGHSIIPDLMKEIVYWFNWLLTPVKKAYNALWSALQTIWNNVAKPLFKTVQTVIQAIPGIINGIIRNAKTYFTNVWDALKLIWKNTGKPFFDLINTVIKAIPGVINGIIKDAKSFFGTVWYSLKTVWANVGKPFFDHIGDVINALVTVVKDIAKPLATAFCDALGGLKTVFRTFKSAFETMWNTLKDIFKAPISFLINTVIDKGIIGGWNWVAGKLHLPLKLSPIHVPGFATGGAVKGKGNGTSDSITAKLSAGEHVWTAREVNAAGGHGAVEKLRQSALTYGQRMKNAQQTAASYGSDVMPRFAGGGAVPGDPGASNPLQQLQNKAKDTVANVKEFIHGMNPKPYKWDEAGPNGWDCSGAISSVYNLLKGTNPYVHTFSTANEGSYLKSGGGAFQAGWFNRGSEGHTAGEFFGLKFEARDTRSGILIGNQAASPNASEFDHIGHLPIADDLYELIYGSKAPTGIAGVISTIGGGLKKAANYVNPMHWIDLLKKKLEGPIQSMESKFEGPFGSLITGIPKALVKSVISKAEDMAKSLIGLGGGGGSNQSESVQANESLARGMLSRYGWGPDQFVALNNLWAGESGWSQFADTRKTGLDAPNASVFAYGIPQARPASKLPKAGRPADMGGSSDPMSQIKWGLDYIRSRYGSPTTAQSWKEGHGWYRNGTQHTKDGWAMVGEAGRELVRMPGGSRVFRNSETNAMIAKAVREATIKVNSDESARINPRYEGKLATATQVTHNEHTENHFHIDKLEMPNIKSGADAEAFIKNLKTFAEGPL